MEMEATARDGGHEQTASSSSSGTIVSTTYTSSRGSRLSSLSLSMEATMQLQFDSLEIMEHMESRWDERKEGHMEHNQSSLVHEFFGAPPSLNCNIEGGGDMERWFAKQGVDWVLHLPPGSASASACRERELEHAFDVRRWIRALNEITETVLSMESHLFQSREPDGDLYEQFPPFIQQTVLTMLFPNRGSADLPIICEQEEDEEEPEALPIICEEGDEPEPESGKQPATASRPHQFYTTAHFFQEAMSKMLGFVDVLANEALVANGVPVPLVKLNALLRVHVAMSSVLPRLLFRLHSSPSAEFERIGREIVQLLSAKVDKACEAVWSTLVQSKTFVLESMEDVSSSQTPQASSDIHKITVPIMGYITLLLDNYKVVNPIASKAARIQTIDVRAFDSLIIEMMTYLEEKLTDISESFLDQELKLLFLLNNLDFMRKRLQSYPFPVLFHITTALTGKVESFMESYLQVFWAPLLSSLPNPKPVGFWKRHSYSFPKFESEFQKIHTTQKLWKVPDPEMRKRLRKTILDKIIPGYIKCIEDSKVTTPKFSPRELEEMVQELFEG